VEIQNYITEDYLSRFRRFKDSSLFEPDFSMLKKFRCPVCSRKLYWKADKSMAYCKSKFKDKFFISQKRLLELGGSLLKENVSY